MTKTEILFIRACKSKDGRKRLNSVYRRMYIKSDNEQANTWHISNILSSICTKLGMTVSQLVQDLDPTHAWRFGWETDVPMETLMLDRLATYIRHMPVDKIPDYIKPCWANKR